MNHSQMLRLFYCVSAWEIHNRNICIWQFGRFPTNRGFLNSLLRSITASEEATSCSRTDPTRCRRGRCLKLNVSELSAELLESATYRGKQGTIRRPLCQFPCQ